LATDEKAEKSRIRKKILKKKPPQDYRPGNFFLQKKRKSTQANYKLNRPSKRKARG